MPLRLSLLDHILARFNLLPVPLFDTPLAAGIAKVLVTACELGIFDELDKQPLALDALAESLRCHPQGLQLLLQLLVSSGYLKQRHGRYANTRMAQRWLTNNSQVSIAPYVIHSSDIITIWDHLPEVVRENKQAVCMPYEKDAHDPASDEALARHYAGLAALAMALGREVIDHVRLPPAATHLLDVGGSHAAYSVLFCHKYPNLDATILDLQAGIEAGKDTAKKTKLEHRLHFVCADIVRDDFTSLLSSCPTYDVALYFHIAHLLPPEVNASIMKKVANMLKPGGVLVYLDQVTDQAHGSHLALLLVQFMALTMTTVGGKCYPFSTVKSWLEQAGMGRVRCHRLLMPGATLITARKL